MPRIKAALLARLPEVKQSQEEPYDLRHLLKWIRRQVITPLRLDPVPVRRDRDRDRRPEAGQTRRNQEQGGYGRQAQDTPEGAKKEARWQNRQGIGQGRIFTLSRNILKCPMCAQHHELPQCPQYLSLSVFKGKISCSI